MPALYKSLIKIIMLTLAYVFIIATGKICAAPIVYSNNYCLMAGSTGQVILSKNLDEVRPIASTTKMMTAILVIEYADLEEIAVVSSNADRTPEYTIGLRTGQEISVFELLKVSLIKSSNDAAVVLAEHIAGDESFFAHLMSKKAFLIGAVNTHFKNASGLPADDHYSTAYDLCQIGRYLLKNSILSELVATQKTEFNHPGYRRPLTISNTNGLLIEYKGADGIKTGTTNASGKCLVAAATRNKQQFIAVVLKSGDRKGDCKRLLDYAFNQSVLVKYIDKNEPFKELKIYNGESPYASIFPATDLFLVQGKESPDIQKKVNCNYLLEAPVARGQKVGSVEIYADGKLINIIDLVCGHNINRENILITPIKNLLSEKRITG
jgi:D-alanyl-D-alanine carboxypeptidase (penicillin-binding protein 5/6)